MTDFREGGSWGLFDHPSMSSLEIAYPEDSFLSKEFEINLLHYYTF